MCCPGAGSWECFSASSIDAGCCCRVKKSFCSSLFAIGHSDELVAGKVVVGGGVESQRVQIHGLSGAASPPLLPVCTGQPDPDDIILCYPTARGRKTNCKLTGFTTYDTPYSEAKHLLVSTLHNSGKTKKNERGRYRRIQERFDPLSLNFRQQKQVMR